MRLAMCFLFALFLPKNETPDPDPKRFAEAIAKFTEADQAFGQQRHRWTVVEMPCSDSTLLLRNLQGAFMGDQFAVKVFFAAPTRLLAMSGICPIITSWTQLMHRSSTLLHR